LAYDFIEKVSKQSFLFEEKNSGKIINLSQTQFIGVYYTLFYDLLHRLSIHIGFNKLKSESLLDLVIIRLVEPASKFSFHAGRS